MCTFVIMYIYISRSILIYENFRGVALHATSKSASAGVVFSKTYFHFDKNATWGFPKNKCLSNPAESVWYGHLRDHDLTYRLVRALGLIKLLNLVRMMFGFRNLCFDGELIIILFNLTSRQTNLFAICVYFDKDIFIQLLASSSEYSYIAAYFLHICPSNQ